MNRAVALRIAACGIMGLGAALLIAALLLSTYTKGKIAKIPLDLDTTLVSDGTGTAFDPASLNARQVRHRPQCPAGAARADQRRGAVERRRGDPAGRQHAAPHRQAAGQRPVAGDGRHRHRQPQDRDRGLQRKQPRRRGAEAARHRRRPCRRPTSPCHTTGWPTDSRSTPRSRPIPFFDPIAQKAFDANYDGEEDVNGLTTYRFSQNVGYDADGKLVEPVKYSSLYDDDDDSEVTARAALWGLPGDPDEPITMTRYYAAQRTFWVDPVSGTIVKNEGARLPLLRA